MKNARDRARIVNLKQMWFEPQQEELDRLKAEAGDERAAKKRALYTDKLIDLFAVDLRRKIVRDLDIERSLMDEYGYLPPEEFDARIAGWKSPAKLLRERWDADHAKRTAKIEAERVAAKARSEADNARRKLQKKKEEELRLREAEELAAWRRVLPGLIDFDTDTSLAHLGFTRSKQLFTRDGTNYFVAAYPSSSSPNKSMIVEFVAEHDVADDEDIIETDSISYLGNGGLKSAVPSKTAKERLTSVLPLLEEAVPEMFIGPKGEPVEKIHVQHYTKSRALARTVISQHVVPALVVAQYHRSLRRRNQQPAEGPDKLSGLLSAPSSALSVRAANAARASYDYAVGKWGIWSPMTEQKLAYELGNKEYDGRMSKKFEAAGLLYEPAAYWEQFEFGWLLRSIASGTLDIKETSRFRQFYLAFLERYYVHCGENVPPDSPGIDRQTIKTTTFAGSSWSNVTNVESVRVKARMWPMMKRYLSTNEELSMQESLDSLNSVIDMLESPRDAFQASFEELKFTTALYADINRFILSVGCSSPFMQQFEESLYRLANDLTPLYKDGKLHNYAAN